MERGVVQHSSADCREVDSVGHFMSSMYDVHIRTLSLGLPVWSFDAPTSPTVPFHNRHTVYVYFHTAALLP